MANEWAVWLFVGPGALRGLDQRGSEIEVVGDEGASLAAALGRALPGQSIPEGVVVAAEEIAEPRLLELLTDEWGGRRTLCPPGASAPWTPEPGASSRSLSEFLTWAAEVAPAKRVALVLVGDILRASGREHLDDGSQPWLDPGRPNKPKHVKIKEPPPGAALATNLQVDASQAVIAYDVRDQDGDRTLRVSDIYVAYANGRECPDDGSVEPQEYRNGSSASAGATSVGAALMLELLDADCISQKSDSRSAGDENDDDPSAGSAGPAYDRQHHPKRPRTGSDRPEPIGRVDERIAAIVEAIEAALPQPGRIELLATDSCDVTVFDHAEALALNVEVLVGAQIEAPTADWPLGDLLAVLQAGAALEAEDLARAIVERRATRGAALWRSCHRVHEQQAGLDDARETALARRVLQAGHDAVAIRSAGLEGLGVQLGALGKTLTGLLDVGDETQIRGLRRGLERALSGYDPYTQRCDLAELLNQLLDPNNGVPESWRRALTGPAEAIRRAFDEHRVVLEQTHIIGQGSSHGGVRGSGHGQLRGLSINLPLRYDDAVSSFSLDGAIQPAWRPVLAALHAADPGNRRRDPGRLALERRFAQDMAAFREPARSQHHHHCHARVTRVTRRPFGLLHYLPGDNREGEGMVESLARLAALELDRVHVCGLLDRPPQLDDRAAWSSARGRLTVAQLEARLEADALEAHPLPVSDEAPAGEALVAVDWQGSPRALSVSPTGALWIWPVSVTKGVVAITGERQLVTELLPYGSLVEAATLACHGEDAGLPSEVVVSLRYVAPGNGARLLPGDAPSRACHWAPRLEQLDVLNSGAAEQLRDFVDDALDLAPARHASLLIGGRANFGGGFSLCQDASETSSMTIPALVEGLRASNSEHGRDRLALLVLADPNMMSLEVAHELIDVAHVLLTPTPKSGEAGPDWVRLAETLDAALDLALVEGIERRAHDELGDTTGPYPEVRDRWRHQVARLAAEAVVEGIRDDEGAPLWQAIDLRVIQPVCRRLDTVCRVAQRELADPAVWSTIETAMTHAAAREPLASLLDRMVTSLRAKLDEAGTDPRRGLLELTLDAIARVQQLCVLRPPPAKAQVEAEALADYNRAFDLHEDVAAGLQAMLALPGEPALDPGLILGLRELGPVAHFSELLAVRQAQPRPRPATPPSPSEVVPAPPATPWYTITFANTHTRLSAPPSAHGSDAVTLAAAAETAVQHWDIHPAEPGWYLIRSRVDGRVLSVEGHSKSKGAKLILEPESGEAVQQWAFGSTGRPMVNRHSGLVADDRYGHVGDWLCHWPHHGKPNQLIALEPVETAEFEPGPGAWYTLTFAHSSHRLAIRDGAREPGAIAIQSDEAASLPHLLWRFTRVEGPWFRVEAHHSGLALDLQNQAVVQQPTTDTPSQQWRVIPTEHGWTLVNRESRQLLAVMAGFPSPGAAVAHEPPQWSLSQSVAVEPFVGEVGLPNDEQDWLGRIIRAVRAWGARARADQRLWIGGDPEHTQLLVYAGTSTTEDYLSLSFHHHVHVLSLLSSYRLLAEYGANPHQLWGLISTGLAYAPSPLRNRLLRRLTGRPIDPAVTRLQYASIGAAPLITMALEDDELEPDRYELRLTSSESAALLLRQQSSVNPGGIDHALGGLDFLLERRQATLTAWHYLESLGASLGEDIINHLHDRLELERQQLLAVSSNEDVHLALAIPRKLMRYPWELMFVPTDSGFQRKEMLAERFAVGRQIWSDRGRRATAPSDGRIRMLIVGDPKTDLAAPLPGARAEARQLAELAGEIAKELGEEMDFRVERDVFVDTTVTRAAMRRLLRDGGYDLVHFAGHGSYSANHPERSAWLLSDGPLWATELRNTLAWCPRPPWMIFANACNSAMTSDRASTGYQGEVYGLAEACIREGVSAYIAPLWQISDKSAQRLAQEVYRALLLGRASVGAALRQARIATRKQCETERRAGAGDISWAGMVLYGNPTDRLFDALDGPGSRAPGRK